MIDFLIVKSAVDSSDPCLFLQYGAPSDEYDDESEMIAESVSAGDTAEEILAVVSKVFSEFHLNIREEVFRKIAADIQRELIEI